MVSVARVTAMSSVITVAAMIRMVAVVHGVARASGMRVVCHAGLSARDITMVVVRMVLMCERVRHSYSPSLRVPLDQVIILAADHATSRRPAYVAS